MFVSSTSVGSGEHEVNLDSVRVSGRFNVEITSNDCKTTKTAEKEKRLVAILCSIFVFVNGELY